MIILMKIFMIMIFLFICLFCVVLTPMMSSHIYSTTTTKTTIISNHPTYMPRIKYAHDDIQRQTLRTQYCTRFTLHITGKQQITNTNTNSSSDNSNKYNNNSNETTTIAIATT